MVERILEWLTAPLSRFSRFVALPALGFVLVLTFVFLGFPYDVLADRAVATLEAQTGAVIRYGEVEPRITVAGPGFRFHQVDVRLPDGSRYSADPVSIRPAWSTSWFSGSPALRAFVISDHGSLAGFLTVGTTYAWDGRIVDLDLALIPLPASAHIELEGRADIEAVLAYSEGMPEGVITLKARNGEIMHDTIPMPVEFETIEGELELGGENLVRIDGFSLDGPLFGGTASGIVGYSSSSGQEPLDLAISIEVREKPMRSMAKQFGLDLDANGKADIAISGTLSRPEMN